MILLRNQGIKMNYFAEVSLVPKEAWWTHRYHRDTLQTRCTVTRSVQDVVWCTRVMGVVVLSRGCYGAPCTPSGYTPLQTPLQTPLYTPPSTTADTTVDHWHSRYTPTTDTAGTHRPLTQPGTGTALSDTAGYGHCTFWHSRTPNSAKLLDFHRNSAKLLDFHRNSAKTDTDDTKTDTDDTKTDTVNTEVTLSH